jgi:hypothetical protein
MLIETVVCFNLTVYQENTAVNIPKIHGIAFRKHCNLSKLEFPALSFDDKSVVLNYITLFPFLNSSFFLTICRLIGHFSALH